MVYVINEIERKIHRDLIELQKVHAEKIDGILHAALADCQSAKEVAEFFEKTKIEHAHTGSLPGDKGRLTLLATISVPKLKRSEMAYVIDESDIRNIRVTLFNNLEYHRRRDQMNAALHLTGAEHVNYLAITTATEATLKRVDSIIELRRDGGH